MKSSLQSKIATVMWGVAALSTLTASVLTGVLLIRNHRDSIHNQLAASVAGLISLGISDYAELEDFEELNLFIEDTLEMEKVDKIVRIYDPAGKMIFSTVGIEYDPLPTEVDLPVEKPVFLTLDGKQRTYESLVVPYLGKGKKKPNYLQVVMPLPKYSQIFARLWWQDLLLLALLLGFSLVLSRRLSKRLLKPVVLIADHLHKMDPNRTEDWHALQIDEQGLYLEEIIRSINNLTQRTRAAVHQIRNMGRYLAHEMRTPLTILRGEAETVLLKKGVQQDDYAAVLRSSLEEVQRLSQTVNTLFQIGEWERASAIFNPVPSDLVKWITENKLRWERNLGRPLVFNSLVEGSPQTVRMDLNLFDHLIDNLIRNVKNHTPPESRCLLTVESKPSGVVVKIDDEGTGLPPSLLEGLNKNEGYEEEVGIGLSLCKKIAEILKIDLRFRNRPEGGLSVLIPLPSDH